MRIVLSGIFLLCLAENAFGTKAPETREEMPPRSVACLTALLGAAQETLDRLLTEKNALLQELRAARLAAQGGAVLPVADVFSVRTRKLLLVLGIWDLSDVLEWTEADLRRIGPAALKEVKEVLVAYELALAPPRREFPPELAQWAERVLRGASEEARAGFRAAGVISFGDLLLRPRKQLLQIPGVTQDDLWAVEEALVPYNYRLREAE